jgi:glycerate 2-kinase
MNHIRSILRTLFTEAIQLSDPVHRVTQLMKVSQEQLCFNQIELNLDSYQHIYVFGAGKGASQVARGLYDLLGTRITSGFVIARVSEPKQIGPITLLPGDHPHPGPHSLASSLVLRSELQKTQPHDLVLFILTGGASAMFCIPQMGVEIQEVQERTHHLLRSGASIHTMNRQRASWDQVKAGKTLGFSQANTWINLLLSDVPGDDPATIGSGPSIPTAETPSNHIPEVFHTMFLDRPGRLAHDVGEALKRQFEGYTVRVQPTAYSDAVDAVCATMCADVWGEQTSTNPQPSIHVYHGESSILVSGNGIGGRNHHLGLQLATELDHKLPIHMDFCILSAGTDGEDGNTGAAGIVIDRLGFLSLKKTKGDPGPYLTNFDSGSYFKDTPHQLKTGPTGTNLMDIQIVLLTHNTATESLHSASTPSHSEYPPSSQN